jgi:hypothetical protein
MTTCFGKIKFPSSGPCYTAHIVATAMPVISFIYFKQNELMTGIAVATLRAV